MSASGFTPISIYYSTTASAVPTAANLVPGELAINTADGKLYYEDSAGVVQVLATKSTGSIGGSNTQVQFNNSGSLGGSSGLTWDGSFLTTSSIKNSALTSGRVTYAGASGLLSDSANLVWDNTNARLGIGTSSPATTLDLLSSVNGLIAKFKSSSTYGQLSIDNGSTTGGGAFIAKQNGVNTTIFGVEGAIQGNTSTDTAIYNDIVGSSIKLFTNANTTPKVTIDSSGNLGLGVTPSAWYAPTDYRAVQVGQSSFVGRITSGAEYTQILSNVFLNSAGTAKYINNGTATLHEMINGAFKWYQAASGTAGNTVSFTQAMTLDSSGRLGIGTSSPSYVLDVAGIGRLTTAVNSNATSLILNNSNTAAGGVGVSIDGYSGNTSNKLAQIVFGGAGATGGNIDFLTSANGSSYVQQMRLDTSGNLGLGVTPSAWFSLDKALQFGGTFSGTTRASALTSQTNDAVTTLWNNAYRNASVVETYFATGEASKYRMNRNAHEWYIAPSGTAGNAISFTQAMTLDASGNLGIGTTSAGNKLQISNGGANGVEFDVALASGTESKMLSINRSSSAYTPLNYDASLHKFSISGGEKMRLNADGQLLLGTTSAFNSAYTMSLKVSGSTGGLIIQPGADSYTAIQFNNAAGSGVGSISVSSTLTSYNVTSDQRLKTNIVDAPSGNIDSIKVRSFDWIADGSYQEYGMVAQELIEVAPYAVTKPVNPDDMMQVDYSKLVPMMIKEIQDLKAEVNQLKSKIGV